MTMKNMENFSKSEKDPRCSLVIYGGSYAPCGRHTCESDIIAVDEVIAFHVILFVKDVVAKCGYVPAVIFRPKSNVRTPQRITGDIVHCAKQGAICGAQAVM